MKIKRKLQFITTFCICMAIVVGLVLFWASQQVSETSRRSHTISEITKDVFELKLTTDDYLLHHTDRAKIQWGSKYKSLAGLLTGDFPKQRD